MKVLITIVIIGLFLWSACKKDDNTPKPDTIEYFQSNLTADMNYAAIVDKFGNPDGDIGSGIHIYVFKLSDKTEVRIGYVDKIFYARHVDENGVLISSIIN
jgi:hypothetical protein